MMPAGQRELVKRFQQGRGKPCLNLLWCRGGPWGIHAWLSFCASISGREQFGAIAGGSRGRRQSLRSLVTDGNACVQGGQGAEGAAGGSLVNLTCCSMSVWHLTETELKGSMHLSFCNSMDHSPPGSSVHGISQAKIDISFSRGSS